MDFKNLPPVKEELMKCVRCGKCRSVCPVFSEIKNETAAPRGHVFMVQMLRDETVKPAMEVYERLSRCLLCETCSVNCPSGIDVHELNAAARSYIYDNNPSAGKEFIFDTLWTRPGLLKTGFVFMWGAQKLGLQKFARNTGLTHILPGDLPRAEKILSDVPLHSARTQLPEVSRANGDKRYRVGYFLGCGTDMLNPEVAIATVNVLTHNGCEVIIPHNMRCCGQPHVANGKLDTARKLMAHNIKVFNSYNFDYIITDCASCSSALAPKNMKFLFKGLNIEDEAMAFSKCTMDVIKFLLNVVKAEIPDISTGHSLKVTYHDPCHLANAQGIKDDPRKLLRCLPGVNYIEMADANTCCGGSGTYSLTHYDLSMKILDRKMEHAMETGADYVATCCPSCMMQLRYGAARHNWNAKVVHPLELLSSFYNKFPDCFN